MKYRIIFAGLFMSLWIGAGNARAEVLTTPVAGPLMLEVDGSTEGGISCRGWPGIILSGG